MSWKPTRRHFLTLGAALPAVLCAVFAKAAEPLKDTDPSKDRGIGGTGWTAGTEGDHGIGGTGIVGTIQRFGSIFVNDVRVAYDPDVPVWIDGVRVAPSSLKVGHVVRVAVVQKSGRVVTSAIHVTSEVVGPVERVGARSIRALGQTIDISGMSSELKIAAGDIVAVYGIRRPDGTIVASLIEARSGETHFLVRGLATMRSGALLVGRLRIASKSSELANRRVEVNLTKVAGGYKVAHLAAEVPVPEAYAASVLYETFLQGQADLFESGLGVAVDDQSGEPKSTGIVRAFLTIGFDRQGNIVSASRQSNGGGRSPNRPGGRPPGGPGGPGDPGGQPPGGPGGPGGAPGGPGGGGGPGGP